MSRLHVQSVPLTCTQHIPSSPLLSLLPHIFHSSSNSLICTLCMRTHTHPSFSLLHTHTHNYSSPNLSFHTHSHPLNLTHTSSPVSLVLHTWEFLRTWTLTHNLPSLPLSSHNTPPSLPPHSSPLHTAFLLNEEADIERRVVCCRGDVDKQTTSASRDTGDRDGEGCRVG